MNKEYSNLTDAFLNNVLIMIGVKDLDVETTNTELFVLYNITFLCLFNLILLNMFVAIICTHY